MLSTQSASQSAVVSELRRLAIPSTYRIEGLDAESFLQTENPYFPTRATAWLLGSHLGFWRADDGNRLGKLSPDELIQRTKESLEDKHLYHETRSEFILQQSRAFNLPVILTVACSHATRHRDGTISLTPVGGENGSYAQYLNFLKRFAPCILFVPTVENSGELYNEKFTRSSDAKKQAIEIAISAHLALIKQALTGTSSVTFLFGGAIGHCMNDTVQALGIKENSVLWDHFSYTNFEEVFPSRLSMKDLREEMIQGSMRGSFEMMGTDCVPTSNSGERERAVLGVPGIVLLADYEF